MAMETSREKVMVLCYWNGCVKYGPDGVFYEGSSTPKKVTVKRKTKLRRLLDELYPIIGLDKQKSKFGIFGWYPVAVSPHRFTYSHLPVVDDDSLETMLEVPSNHTWITSVELYLEVKPTSDDVIFQPSSSSKRQRIQQEVVDKNPNSDGCLNKVVDLKPCLQSRLWTNDDHELRVGLCFKDRDELRKAVVRLSIKGQRKFVVKETKKDMCKFGCIRQKCKWSLVAAKMEKHGLFEISKYTGPHTCLSENPDEIVADEIEHVVRAHPTQSFEELKKWWKENIGYELETSEVREAKEKAIKRLFGDCNHNFKDLPKLMSAFCSSNGLLVDWKYDMSPNPKLAAFCGVFWAFPKSIEGFQRCRPLIVVDIKEFNSEFQLKLMIASGVDADGYYFPLAFAVTKEVSVDSWRWFLSRIREKVTQRKGLCLISTFYPDILAVINEPGLCGKNHGLITDYVSKLLAEKAGSTSRKEEFDFYMKAIEKRNPEARKWLDQIPPHQWALAHDSGLRYGITKIDSRALYSHCRVFQFADHALTGFVLLLFDELRHSFNQTLSRICASLNSGDVYTKPILDKFQEFKRCSFTYVVLPLEEDNNAFQVKAPSQNDVWIVQLSDGGTCTCGEFQNFKFPCLHAVAVCEKLEINPLQFVDDCYTLERYHKTYAAKFNPVPKLSAWPEATEVPTLFPPPRVVADETEEIPSDEDLRNEIVDILEVVDYKAAMVNDIFKRVGMSLKDQSCYCTRTTGNRRKMSVDLS